MKRRRVITNPGLLARYIAYIAALPPSPDGPGKVECPACLSKEVDAIGALHWIVVGNEMTPVSRMHCNNCGAKWWVAEA